MFDVRCWGRRFVHEFVVSIIQYWCEPQHNGQFVLIFDPLFIHLTLLYET